LEKPTASITRVETVLRALFVCHALRDLQKDITQSSTFLTLEYEVSNLVQGMSVYPGFSVGIRAFYWM